jgi:hypothetical protein
MGRIRTVKPDFFRHEELYDLEITSGLPIRLAFAGLWTCCDREGRFKWRIRTLKTEVLPFDDVDFSRVLDALRTREFIVKYRVGNEDFGHVPSWSKHQFINPREQASDIPEPPLIQELDALLTGAPREIDANGTDVVKERKVIIHTREARVNVWAELWNNNCKSLPRVKKMTPALHKAVLQVGKDFSDEEFLAAVKTIASHEFTSGANDRKWKATFTWLLRPKTAQNTDSSLSRVLNGEFGQPAETAVFREANPEDWWSKAGVQ